VKKETLLHCPSGGKKLANFLWRKREKRERGKKKALGLAKEGERRGKILLIGGGGEKTGQKRKNPSSFRREGKGRRRSQPQQLFYYNREGGDTERDGSILYIGKR